MNKKTNEVNESKLAKQEEYKILTVSKEDMEEFQETVQENTGGELGFSSFLKIKVPTGGGIFWSLFNPETGEEESTKQFTGVVIKKQTTRGYWEGAMTSENKKPLCSSGDGINGTLYGSCTTCPKSKFQNNEIPECKERQLIYILREGSLLPTVLSVPRTSMKNFRIYGANLLGLGKRISSVITKFTLEKKVSGAGQEYSEVKFTMHEQVSKEEAKMIRATFTPLVENVMQHMAEYSVTDATDEDTLNTSE